MHESIITAARKNFHKQLISQGTLSISYRTVKTNQSTGYKEWVVSNADISQASSRAISLHIAKQLDAPKLQKNPGQTAGVRFEEAVTSFLEKTFTSLSAVRPGRWRVENIGNSRNVDYVSRYHLYRHLHTLAQAIAEKPDLQSVFGNSYVISPDIVILREAATDSEINSLAAVVDDHAALISPFRAANAFRHSTASCSPPHLSIQ